MRREKQKCTISIASMVLVNSLLSAFQASCSRRHASHGTRRSIVCFRRCAHMGVGVLSLLVLLTCFLVVFAGHGCFEDRTSFELRRRFVGR